jgi:mono/diheme cytochrome c family protein
MMSASPVTRIKRTAASIALALAAGACNTDEPATGLTATDADLGKSFNPSLIAEGREIFRFDTFGNETFWSDTAALQTKIADVVTPLVALTVGLKVDADALPASLRADLIAGDVDLNSTAITIALLGLNAVVGVVGLVENGTLVRVGITCALCHSTVDNSVIAGVGRRLDGWPNRDLDVGAIIALSDAIPDAPYNSWGPGMYDPRFSIDGQSVPVVLPPAFGLRHVKKEIYTGDDDVSYWNAYVAITQMHGHGTFVDPRIKVSVSNPPDLVSSRLNALRAYQLSLDTPAPRPGTFDATAASRGSRIFRQSCAGCHQGTILSDVNANRLHDPDEVGQDATYARRSATKQYRTTPLRGLWNPPQLDGPYFHDGSAPTLAAVVDHYVTLFGLSFTSQQKADLVEYLKTL